MLNRTQKSNCLAAAFILISAVVSPVQADTFKLGVQEAASYKQAEIVSSPEPIISAELKEECLKTYCEARFSIDPKGKFAVSLITSSGSAEVDDITVSCLRSWKFRPARRGAEPVASTRKIRVEFVVE
jgi:TonB family protein